MEDAFIATLDEVRHRRTSLDITRVSWFEGKLLQVHCLNRARAWAEFGSDGIGCGEARLQDETLSAIAAAFVSLESKYTALDVSTAALIRNELNSIVMEEVNHSYLTWRTLFWVCRMFEAVNDEVSLSFREDRPGGLEEMLLLRV